MDQLSIRYGYPYVFRHLDDCEHLVVFTDARLMAPDDPQNVTDYPLVRMAPPEIIYCDACEAYPSHWIVDDPEFCPTKWTHFCKVCFGSFYYCNGKFTTRPITVHQFPQLQWPPQPASSSVPTNTSIDCANFPSYQLISEAQVAPDDDQVQLQHTADGNVLEFQLDMDGVLQLTPDSDLSLLEFIPELNSLTDLPSEVFISTEDGTTLQSL